MTKKASETTKPKPQPWTRIEAVAPTNEAEQELVVLRERIAARERDYAEIQNQLRAAQDARATALKAKAEVEKELEQARRCEATHKDARERARQALETAQLELEYARERVQRITASVREETRTDRYLLICIRGAVLAFIAFVVVATLGDIRQRRYDACVKTATTPEERMSCREGL